MPVPDRPGTLRENLASLLSTSLPQQPARQQAEYQSQHQHTQKYQHHHIYNQSSAPFQLLMSHLDYIVIRFPEPICVADYTSSYFETLWPDPLVLFGPRYNMSGARSVKRIAYCVTINRIYHTCYLLNLTRIKNWCIIGAKLRHPLPRCRPTELTPAPPTVVGC
jgi:hypothetical protein